MHDWDAPQDKEICAKRYRDAGGEDPLRGDDGGWLNPTKVTNIQLGKPVLRVPVVASSGLVTKADELSAAS